MTVAQALPLCPADSSDNPIVARIVAAFPAVGRYLFGGELDEDVRAVGARVEIKYVPGARAQLVMLLSQYDAAARVIVFVTDNSLSFFTRHGPIALRAVQGSKPPNSSTVLSKLRAHVDYTLTMLRSNTWK